MSGKLTMSNQSHNGFSAFSIFNSEPRTKDLKEVDTNIQKSVIPDEYHIKGLSLFGYSVPADIHVRNTKSEMAEFIDKNNTVDEYIFKIWHEKVKESGCPDTSIDQYSIQRTNIQLCHFQRILNINSGFLIQFVRWLSRTKNEKPVGQIDVCTKWRKSIGYFPKSDLIKRSDIDQLEVNDMLEEEMKKFIPPDMALECQRDIDDFLLHINFVFNLNIKYKHKKINMGTFWLH